MKSEGRGRAGQAEATRKRVPGRGNRIAKTLSPEVTAKEEGQCAGRLGHGRAGQWLRSSVDDCVWFMVQDPSRRPLRGGLEGGKVEGPCLR